MPVPSPSDPGWFWVSPAAEDESELCSVGLGATAHSFQVNIPACGQGPDDAPTEGSRLECLA